MEKTVPEELAEIMDECIAAEKARDAAAKVFFKFQLRNCVYCGKIAEKKRREFWTRLCDIYPDLRDKKLSYNNIYRTVKEIID